jgi:hypothetical protein
MNSWMAIAKRPIAGLLSLKIDRTPTKVGYPLAVATIPFRDA